MPLKLNVPHKACNWEQPACVQAEAVIDPQTSKVAVIVTDTKQNTKHGDLAPQLNFTAAEWSAFIAAAKRGEFDIEDMDLNEPVRATPQDTLV